MLVMERAELGGSMCQAPGRGLWDKVIGYQNLARKETAAFKGRMQYFLMEDP